jgi:hypothetical protein
MDLDADDLRQHGVYAFRVLKQGRHVVAEFGFEAV